MWVYVHLLLKSVVRERNRQTMANKRFADGIRFWVFKLLFEPSHKKSFFLIFPSLHLLSVTKCLFSSTVLATYIKGSEMNT